MRIRYPALQNQDVDHQEPNHEVVPGAWRNAPVMQDMQQVLGGNVATREAKQQRLYLKYYYNTVAPLAWQNMIL